MALYPRQNSRHLIMRPTKKTTLGVRAGLSFTSFRLRYSLRTRPFATDSGFATRKVNYSTVNFIDLKLGTLKLEC